MAVASWALGWVLLWSPPSLQDAAPAPKSESGRPEYVRLHGFDGQIYEGRYQGMDSRRDHYLITDAAGEMHLVPRASIERIEPLATPAKPLPLEPVTRVPPPGVPSDPATLPPPPGPTVTMDDHELRKRRRRAVAFGVTSGLALTGSMAIRLAYARGVQDIECRTFTGFSGTTTTCRRGAGLVEPALLYTSWLPMAAGMTFAGLAGNNAGRASAISDPTGRAPQHFILAGALTLTAGLGYFALSRPSAVAYAWTPDRRRILVREINFSASAMISYVGAGLLGFGVSRRSSLARRNLSIAPTLSPEGAALTLSFNL